MAWAEARACSWESGEKRKERPSLPLPGVHFELTASRQRIAARRQLAPSRDLAATFLLLFGQMQGLAGAPLQMNSDIAHVIQRTGGTCGGSVPRHGSWHIQFCSSAAQRTFHRMAA